MNKKQIKLIIDRLNLVQKKSSVRTINEKTLEEILHKNKRKPFFNIDINGGGVGGAYRYRAETTSGVIEYDRKSNHFKFHIDRTTADKNNSCSHILIDTTNRINAVSFEKRTLIRRYLLNREKRKHPEYNIYWDVYKEQFKYQIISSAFGEEFHLPVRNEPYKTEKNLRNAIRNGKKRIIARLRQDKTRNKIKEIKEKLWGNIDNLKKVFVTVNDSINSGNCRPETFETKKAIVKLYGNIEKIRADKLMDIRHDVYVKRAIEYASVKYLKDFS